MTQHATLDAGRWSSFSRAGQLLMIANEMNRASRLQGAGDLTSRRLAYERVLRLVDLTVETRPARSRMREILRWRDVVASLYLQADPDPVAHRAALRALLLQSAESARQLPHLSTMGGRP